MHITVRTQTRTAFPVPYTGTGCSPSGLSGGRKSSSPLADELSVVMFRLRRSPCARFPTSFSGVPAAEAEATATAGRHERCIAREADDVIAVRGPPARNRRHICMQGEAEDAMPHVERFVLDGRTNGRTDGQMDGWMLSAVLLSSPRSFSLSLSPSLSINQKQIKKTLNSR